MGMGERPYWRGGKTDEYAGEDTGAVPAFRLGLPRPGRVVLALLIANAAVFLLQVFQDQPGAGWMSPWLGVTAGGFWQLWRYLTFQFLHAGVGHIAMNMLGLYMLGTPLEELLGPRRFLAFYLFCGALAGLAYVAVSAAAHLPPGTPIIGASGGVFGIILACAVLLPETRVILLVFPITVRLLAILVFAGAALVIVQAVSSGDTPAAMSDVAHFGGALGAAAWIWGLPRLPRFRRPAAGPKANANANSGAWQRRMKERAEEQARVDEVLKKIHDKGIASLTHHEKKILQDATRHQREEERQINRL